MSYYALTNYAAKEYGHFATTLSIFKKKFPKRKDDLKIIPRCASRKECMANPYYTGEYYPPINYGGCLLISDIAKHDASDFWNIFHTIGY